MIPGDTATATDTRDSGIHSNATGASVIQVETLGRMGMIVILIMFVMLVGLGVLAGFSVGVGEARGESMDTQLRQMNSRVSVLEYDTKSLCAQLLSKQLVEVCH